jgi:transcriptional regulator with XRE-family HTH domain
VAVQALREALRHSLEEFADRIGASEKSVRNWEQGRHRPLSASRRQLDTTLRGLTAEERERFQARVPSPDGQGPRVQLLTSFTALVDAMTTTVSTAREVIVTTGSRSSEASYLETIERAVERRPALVHYRVLFGPPRTEILRAHLARLDRLRPGDGAGKAVPTLFVGVVDDYRLEPERFICASERRAVLAIPSLVTPGNFDTGVAFQDPATAQGLVQHVKQLYWGTRRLTDSEALQTLAVES